MNPTTKVPSEIRPYGMDAALYLNYPSGVSDTFVNGEMVGVNPATGYGAHCDDTQPMRFMGLFSEPTKIIVANYAPLPILLMVNRPRFFSMPLASGTQSRGYQMGAPVFAVDSGHVQIGAAGLNYGNQVGYFFDIQQTAPENSTGATAIWISPEPCGTRSEKAGGVLVAPASGGHTYGVEALNKIIEVPTTAAETITLPAIADTVSGDLVTVINTGGAFAVTVDASGSDHINGASSYAMAATAYTVLRIVSDGTQWLAI